ncbi:glycerophosphodiester phosphodiesterase family protein [Celeribacter sp.]|uniref:glycerophosphodiester phosphodiesterase family protein n=1 Tax=Celeribacter sp. TaxID=1890673 RepID=UPI003A91C445
MPVPPLPNAFLIRPIAHRALHDGNRTRAENGRLAVEAAIARGYGIEIDVQPSADGDAMVFHDYDLGRVTTATGAIRQRSADALANVSYRTGEVGIPTLAQICDQIAGRVPLLIEIKDQDGMMGSDIGTLGSSVAKVLRDYEGPLAVMSFNPHAVAEMRDLLPDVPRGLTTSDFPKKDWLLLSDARRAELASLDKVEAVGASFISHKITALDHPPVLALKERGIPVLCWTVKSAAQEIKARKVAQNITFEGYLPA